MSWNSELCLWENLEDAINTVFLEDENAPTQLKVLKIIFEENEKEYWSVNQINYGEIEIMDRQDALDFHSLLQSYYNESNYDEPTVLMNKLARRIEVNWDDLDTLYLDLEHQPGRKK